MPSRLHESLFCRLVSLLFLNPISSLAELATGMRRGFRAGLNRSLQGSKYMADIEIAQAEADALIAMEKHRVDDKEWSFPGPGEAFAIPLASVDKRENFMLDVTRGRIKLTKATYQNRARQAIILMRLDLDGPPHR